MNGNNGEVKDENEESTEVNGSVTEADLPPSSDNSYSGGPVAYERPIPVVETVETVEPVETPKNNTYIRLRGLPFSSTESDIRQFLGDIPVEKMHFTQTFDGRPSGECYCQLQSVSAVEEAKKLDKKEMKTRYVEVFSVDDHELALVLSKRETQQDTEGCIVRLRGLPYSCSKDSITDFFQGLRVVDVIIEKEQGGVGRPSGEGYVKFDSREHAEQALQRNRQTMGHRYIEVFRSTLDEMERCNNPYGMPRAKGPPQSLLSLPPVRPPPAFDRPYGGAYPPAYPAVAPSGYHGSYEDRPGPGAMRSRGPPASLHHRPSPYDRPSHIPRSGDWSGSANRVYMRGLPYRVTPDEIEAFFAPIPPVEIFLGFGEDGRPSGEGAIDFGNVNDAHAALGRNQNKIGTRYIELFHGPDGLPGADSRSQLRSVRVARRPMPSTATNSQYAVQSAYDQSAYSAGGYGNSSAYASGYAAQSAAAYSAASTAYAAQPTAAYGYGGQSGQQGYHQQYEQAQQYWSTAQATQPHQQPWSASSSTSSTSKPTSWMY